MPSQPSSSSHQLFILTQISQISRKMHCCARISLRDGYFFNHRWHGSTECLIINYELWGQHKCWTKTMTKTRSTECLIINSELWILSHQPSTIILTQKTQKTQKTLVALAVTSRVINLPTTDDTDYTDYCKSRCSCWRQSRMLLSTINGRWTMDDGWRKHGVLNYELWNVFAAQRGLRQLWVLVSHLWLQPLRASTFGSSFNSQL